jgi:energy-coupling factor transporter ATP-binding protein EcfA2
MSAPLRGATRASTFPVTQLPGCGLTSAASQVQVLPNAMNDTLRITSVRFSRFKALREFSLALDRFNILVGPNNSGKSTILGAFRILAEGLRRARTRKAGVVQGPHGLTRGYEINLEGVPVATENVFHNYQDDTPATVRFRLSSGDHLMLFFPRVGVCSLICETLGHPPTSPSSFTRRFNVDIGFVPILGPVEHNEPLYQHDAAREALLTHRASRNFRNIWYHYPESFDEFRSLIQTTWPGMDIKPPELDTSHEPPLLRMFCPEDRFDREIFWAGFGFQVWCQMLTFMVRNKTSSLFIIDEPDIYLHADLQRQLMTALRALGPDIVLATHSTEIVSEADPNEILVITKRAQSAKRVGDLTQLRSLFSTLGSNLNPILTQLARSKRVVYVEGKDFTILSRFASKLKVQAVATRSDFAVVPTQGFNPLKVKMFSEGAAATLGTKLLVAVIFDRDYRSDEERDKELQELRNFCYYAHIHSKKELENFLIVPEAIVRAIYAQIDDRVRRTGVQIVFSESIATVLSAITEPMKHDVQAQFLKRRHPFAKTVKASLDDATITSALLADFDDKWKDLDVRVDIVPGKEVLARLNTHLQSRYGITVTPTLIIGAMRESEIHDEMKSIVHSLNGFSQQPVA